MPKPRDGEKESDFISRCMRQVGNESDKKNWTQKRKLGYCYGLWRQGKSKSSEPEFKFAEG